MLILLDLKNFSLKVILLYFIKRFLLLVWCLGLSRVNEVNA